MGLLNNWLKKKDKEQLGKAGEQKTPAAVVAKKSSAKIQSEEKKKTVKKKEEKAHDHADHEEKKVKAVQIPKVTVAAHSQSFRILIKPLVTEKSAIAESMGKYSFVVAQAATKDQVKTAVAEIYGVKPISVNVSNVDGRPVRFGRSLGRRSDYKKAVVTLPAGKTIDIHAGV